jgi:2-succinyl-5-enolpyruvyl-6-hydroxy-3-cyclohexene-1-carboxylate synthase
MTAPNHNTLWADALVAELAEAGVDAVCLAPGSRSTPLTVAFAEHEAVQTFSHLDERSAAFFALGRGRVTGTPTPVVCTSGTAAANFHPAVLEASESRVPLLVLTADRPPELSDSGANQTTDQEKLYGDAVRWYRTLAEPEAEARKLRSLRTTAARAVAETTGTPPGPVHLNVPFRKPLEPTPVPGDVPAEFGETAPLAAGGRGGPFVETGRGELRPSEGTVSRLATAIEGAERGLIVAGPADSPTPGREPLSHLAAATGFPVLADPLSGHRFGPHTDRDDVTICGGYDSYLDAAESFPDPGVVLRFGASPTSKTLRNYLAAAEARQVVVDPAGGWREAEFTATDLLAAAPDAVATALAAAVESPASGGYRELFEQTESGYWEAIGDACTTGRETVGNEGATDGPTAAESATADDLFEGAVLHTVAEECPGGATLFVSNSMPVRDLDRFGEPRSAPLNVLGNRGVSGIDGVTSTALGAGSAADGPLVLVIGDIAYYHDMNGLLALRRCGVDATVVLIDNDGGGIFHTLPVESFDPPFTEQFRTPHGLDFSPTGDLYGFSVDQFAALGPFREALDAAVGSGDTRVLSVQLDAERSHRRREAVHEAVCRSLPSSE